MDQPHLFRLILYREYQSGASVEHLALMFGIPESWVHDYLNEARIHEQRTAESTPHQPRNCCGTSVCPRSEIARLITPEDPFEQHVETAACAAAKTCSNLSIEDLRWCFSQFFEIDAACEAFERFHLAYLAEARRTGQQTAITAGAA